jgi:hypothetical protein
MCEAVLARATETDVFLRMLSPSVECGRRDDVVGISKKQIYQVNVVHRNTSRRAAVGVLAGLGAIGGIAAIAAHVGSVQGALFAIPAAPFAAAGAWAVIPNRRESILLIQCQDRFHCFSIANATPQGTQATRDER